MEIVKDKRQIHLCIRRGRRSLLRSYSFTPKERGKKRMPKKDRFPKYSFQWGKRKRKRRTKRVIVAGNLFRRERGGKDFSLHHQEKKKKKRRGKK